MVATVSNGYGSMLSVVIATHESERALVPTLAALVPGAAAGLLGEVVVADAGSRDATAEVADVAGCRFISSTEPIGTQLKVAAASTRGPWLMFLRAGAVPQAGWIEAVDRFMAASDISASRAGVFMTPSAGIRTATRPKQPFYGGLDADELACFQLARAVRADT